MATTDRELLKQQQAGALGTTGASTPIASVARVHGDVFTFESTSDAAMAEIGMRIDAACRVKSVYITPSVALAKHASAYTVYTVAKRDGAGGAADTVATLTTEDIAAGVALAAFEPAAFTLTDANVVFAAGEVLTFKSAETGAPTSPIGKVTVLVEWV